MNHAICWTWLIACCLPIAFGQHKVCAQDSTEIAIRVTAVFEDSIYLDKGTAEGVKEGNTVRISTRYGQTLDATVRSVSSHSARCVSNTGGKGIQVGMQGQVVAQKEFSQFFPTTPSIVDSSLALSDQPTVIAPVDFQASSAPGAIVRIPVRVTATAGAGLYLNNGRAVGIEPGDEVVLYPPSAGIVNLVVQSVSRHSSRCSAATNLQQINIDTRGEVLIPSDRLTEPAEIVSTPQGNVPEHTPWEQPAENWDQNMPLLAPVYSTPREERESKLHGRVFGQYLHSWNRNVGDNQYSLGRLGANIRYENPFRKGGTLRVNGEFNRRGIFLDDFRQVSDPGWFNRLSYRVGGAEDQPFEIEVGRFYPSEFPAAGILDGAALVYRTEGGNRIMLSVGYLPEPFPNLFVRNDLQVGLFYRWIADEEEILTSGIGVQKTWHQGTPDRDLLVQTVDYNPNDHFSIHSSLWGDLYDSHDTLKNNSFEITQMLVQPMLRIDPGHGLGVNVSYLRWPQLLRQDFSPFVNSQIVNGRVLRYGVFTWQQLSDRIRLDGRVNRWDDERTKTGTSWETRIAFRDLLYSNGQVSLAVFGTEGLYSTGPGGRISLSRQFPWCYASVWYELYGFDLSGNSDPLLTGTEPTEVLQQSLRTNLDFTFGTDKSVSVFGDYRFGQSQDAFQLGIFFQKRL